MRRAFEVRRRFQSARAERGQTGMDRGQTDTDRGQTGLPALAIALLVLTVATGLGLAVADGALASAERDADESRVASSLAARIVGVDSTLTERENVLNGTRLDRFDANELEQSFPVSAGYDVRIRVNESVVAETGDASGGSSFRRLVVVERTQRRTLQPDLGFDRVVTLPRRTSRATLNISPPQDTTVTTVRANDRVILHDADGLAGEFAVALSRFETTAFRFTAVGPLPAGSVTVRYPAPRTTKTTLVVTVDG